VAVIVSTGPGRPFHIGIKKEAILRPEAVPKLIDCALARTVLDQAHLIKKRKEENIKAPDFKP
jgi:hypothetical protein